MRQNNDTPGAGYLPGQSGTEKAGEAAAAALSGYALPLVILVVVMMGVAGGVGSFTFGYARGASYLSNDPKACINCHVMQDHYDSWLNSSHENVAVCNDCHLPHDFLGKWLTKGDNGFFHSVAFTLENFHEPIQIKPRNRRVTQNACLYCHGDVVHQMLPAQPDGDMLLCIQCHNDAGHAAARKFGSMQ